MPKVSQLMSGKTYLVLKPHSAAQAQTLNRYRIECNLGWHFAEGGGHRCKRVSMMIDHRIKVEFGG